MKTTSNRMELQAVLEGFRRFIQLAKDNRLTLISDSRYLIDGLLHWLDDWSDNKWKKKDGQPVINRDLWEKIHCLKKDIQLKCVHVHGHSGHPENERVDQLAVDVLKKAAKRGKKSG